MNGEVEGEAKVFGLGTWVDSITTKKIMSIKGGGGVGLILT